MKVHYLLSASFPYEHTICSDAGPGYARRQQWTTAPLSALGEAAAGGPAVIDNRLTEPELAPLAEMISRHPRHPVYLKVVDPHWECLQQPYYQLLCQAAARPNVCFVGPYQPTRLTGFLSELAGRPAYLHLPFSYESARELPVAGGTGRLTLSFSGATDATYYPERAAVLHQLQRRWFSRGQISILPHPGYPDVGQPPRHAITGPAYLQFLARHRFMYVEPSRDGLEFLKYSECAYAGCVPVGQAPVTFDPELAGLILPFRSGHLRDDYQKLRACPVAESDRLAREYRARLQQKRDPQRATGQLVQHWKTSVARLAGL